MKLTDAFPSNFLKASDLNGKSVTVTIESAEIEEFGQGQNKENKLVVSFRGKEKSLICNKTNATTIAKLYGDETDNWIGQRITLAPREVEFQGETVWSIRVSLQKPASATQAPAPAVAEKPATQVSETDGGNDIPF
jgi:hypothetical protein